jgi:hypothetical protein
LLQNAFNAMVELGEKYIFLTGNGPRAVSYRTTVFDSMRSSLSGATARTKKREVLRLARTTEKKRKRSEKKEKAREIAKRAAEEGGDESEGCV